ncbi:phosphatidylserine decarboxylase [Aquimarina sp. TRL1]|uniref:phosphatidylserine decarboxylase n=1 Tax=Aquimarina sp. (strain TRL1) TaxID=2736252 RepID=UPI00158AFCCE|nr:phosphatidylserine decarboxylase [Aquimarina sp. TRL1]QKX07060.1 phosphatidylserine decarboxylase [Aquimarina sp. TRL1]
MESTFIDVLQKGVAKKPKKAIIYRHEEVVVELQEIVHNHPMLGDAITASLIAAKKIAVEKKLKNMDKFEWPQTLNEYYSYLDRFVRWIPTEADISSKENYDQEIMNKLCHFYWLINHVQNIPVFSEWLVTFANDWGSFLNTPESITPESLQSFMNQPLFKMEDYMIPPGAYTPEGKGAIPNNASGWLTFNQFFAREALPGKRPVDEMRNDQVVVSPADAEFKEEFPINENSEIIIDGKASLKTKRIKGTHAYSIKELIAGSGYEDAFANGTYMHSFLSPYDLHRFCAPVAGEVKYSKAIQGKVFLEVTITDDGEFDAPDNASNGYEFKQTRGVLILDTGEKNGLVAVIPVGMAQVSSVNMNATAGVHLFKGQEFGYFLFGGSDIILLYQEKSNFKLEIGNEKKKLAGNKIGVFQTS